MQATAEDRFADGGAGCAQLAKKFCGRGWGGPPLDERGILLRGAKRCALDWIRGINDCDLLTAAEIRDELVAGLMGGGLTYIEAEAEAAGIVEAIERREEWRASRESSGGPADDGEERRLHVVDAVDFIKQKLPPRRMILAPWLAEQSIVMIHAYRGTGKTHIALGAAGAIATAGEILGWQAPEALPVLYADGEMPGADMQDRVRGILSRGRQPAPGFFRILTPDLQSGPMPNLATPRGQLWLEPHLDGIKVLFVDNISTLCNGGPENDSDSWLGTQEWALSLRRRGIATVFVHHSGKGGVQRGTSKREDVLDSVIALKRPDDYRADQGARFEVHFEKARGFFGRDAESFEATLETDEHGVPVWTVAGLDDRLEERVNRLADEGLTQRQIADEVKKSAATVNRILKGRWRK